MTQHILDRINAKIASGEITIEQAERSLDNIYTVCCMDDLWYMEQNRITGEC